MAKNTHVAPTEVAEAFEHGWAATTGGNPLDQKIRALGYRIEWRPKKGDVIWSKHGVEYTEADILYLHPEL